MKIGNIVRLSRPWDGGSVCKNAIGIVENITTTTFIRDDTCRVRFVNGDGTHYTPFCLKNRFDIIRE